MHTAPDMNGRARRPPAAFGAKAAPKSDSRVMEKDPRNAATPVKKGSTNAGTRGTMNRIQSRRERKLALQQDVDKLKKKLRHEENVHRALERAFTRPLGALPRLPPYLPSQTLALLAEVAVLEEEVVRLEEQVVNFRQGIYQEAIIFSSAKNAQFPGGEAPVPAQLIASNPVLNSEASPTTVSRGSDHPPNARPSPNNGVANGKQTPRKPVVNTTTSPPSQDDRSGAGKENQSCSNTSSTSSRQTPPFQQKTPKSRATPPDRRVRAATPAAHQTNTAAPADRKRPAAAGSNLDKVTTSHDDSSSSVPNKLSEELLRCLLTIFSQMGSAGACVGRGDEDQQAPSPSVSGSSSSSGSEDAYPQDPYGILELGTRDIGPYKRFHVVDAASFDPANALAGDGDGDTPLVRRLKALLRRLSSVDLAELSLSHQQKLAFWINVYNSCMMNAFLEQGIPTTPQMLVAMMSKATISVGGHTHSAMSIEHFILRLPYSAKQVDREEGANGGDDVTAVARGAFGLEWPEPLVTFALSCGSWSSPAVRVYTATRVEEELKAAKREYLQAAVGVSAPGKLAVPKLLHWYLLDFAKDVDALMDWVCLQLPPELRHKAMRVVEDGRRQRARRIQVLPYEFRFRYLLAS